VVKRVCGIDREGNHGKMPLTKMIQKAEHVLSYAMTLTHRSYFPQLNSDAMLVEQSRQILTAVTTGVSAQDRVYNEIKMRASVRFPALPLKHILDDETQSVMLSSYAVPGLYSYQAWNDYVQPAIEKAAQNPTESKDWVLNISKSDDLSLSGSPEQSRKQLTDMYKRELSVEW